MRLSLGSRALREKRKKQKIQRKRDTRLVERALFPEDCALFPEDSDSSPPQNAEVVVGGEAGEVSRSGGGLGGGSPPAEEGGGGGVLRSEDGSRMCEMVVRGETVRVPVGDDASTDTSGWFD
jgi:hypothetical protein